MTRDDERKQMAGMARSPRAAREEQEEIVGESHESREADDPMGHESMDSSMARTPAAAKRGAERHEREERSEEEGEKGTVRGGRSIMHEKVDADHVMGDGGKIGVSTAEGTADMASAKANRKEAEEPEREANEKAAMGRERTTPHKNTMGHGERETVAKHTI